MTFKLTPAQFPLLQKELTDSGQVSQMWMPTESDGDVSGTITHGNVKGQATYSPSTLTLTLNVTDGGGLLVDHEIHKLVQNAIDALKT